ncbi:hypothetical protein XENORESO_013449, partial [Xenotaenia resolanae]
AEDRLERQKYVDVYVSKCFADIISMYLTRFMQQTHRRAQKPTFLKLHTLINIFYQTARIFQFVVLIDGSLGFLQVIHSSSGFNCFSQIFCPVPQHESMMDVVSLKI